jgi:hypothetical protein
MKVQLTLHQQHSFKAFSFIGPMMLTLLALYPIYSQTKTVTSTEITSNERIT